MQSDFIYWMKENNNLLEDLKNHESKIYDNYSDLLRVLTHISKKDEKDIDADLSFIFDEGYAYIFNRVSELKEYIHSTFNDEMALYYTYEPIIYYLLYIDDLRDVITREEMDMTMYDKSLKELSDKLLTTINDRKKYDQVYLDDVNRELVGIMPSTGNLMTTPEIFTRILDELIFASNKQGLQFKD